MKLENHRYHRYNIFLSCKSEDYDLGEQVYNFLEDKGISVFFATRELKIIGESDYGKEIDKALDESEHLIVITSHKEYLFEETSPYVYYEWHSFSEEKKCGRKKGNILTILTSNLKIADLPYALRYCQSFLFQEFHKVLHYLNLSVNFPENNTVDNNLQELCNQESQELSNFVDLGLNVLWSSCNLGSKVPCEAGCYFAWGEPITYGKFIKENCRSEGLSLLELEQDNITDTKGRILKDKDAASKAFGAGIRIPSVKDFEELVLKCSFKWDEENGISGYRITGPSNRSIFMPVTGYKQGETSFYARRCGYYWSSAYCDTYDGKFAYGLFFDQNEIFPRADMRRYQGLAIRPVADKRKGSVLSKKFAHEKLKIEFRWDNNCYNCDLEMSAFLLGHEGCLLCDDDFVFYNSNHRTEKFDNERYRSRRRWIESTRPQSLDGSVIGETLDWIEDEDGELHRTFMTLDLNKVRPEICEIVFCLSVYQDEDFESNKPIKLIVYDLDENIKLVESELIHKNGWNAMVVCHFERFESDNWRFEPVDKGFHGGLNTIIDKYS